MKFHNKFERQKRWSSNKIRPEVDETTRGTITKRIELRLWYSIKIVASICPRTFYSFSCILLSMNEESHLYFCDYPRTMTTTMCLWTETHCSRNRTRRRLEREEQIIERDKEAELFMTQGGLICKKDEEEKDIVLINWCVCFCQIGLIDLLLEYYYEENSILFLWYEID